MEQKVNQARRIPEPSELVSDVTSCLKQAAENRPSISRFTGVPSFQVVCALRVFGVRGLIEKCTMQGPRCKPKNRKATQSLDIEFTTLNLAHALLLAISSAPAGQKFVPKLALLFLGSLHDSDFFSTLLVLRLYNVWAGTLLCLTQQLDTVLEAHTIKTHSVKKL
jgi:hypothetical protein